MKFDSVKRILLAVLAFTSGLMLLFSQVQPQVGYSVITAKGSDVPVGTALFSFTNSSGVLVWEAGVGAVEPIRSGKIFVDQVGTRTAVALVNPSSTTVSATFILRDASGKEVNRTVRTFNPRQHLALFIDELFQNLSVGFVGSLTFDTEPASQKLAAITLRENKNVYGESIFATLPVVDVSAPLSTESIVFPQAGAGPGLSTQLVLINRGNQRISGRIKLYGDDGAPLLVQLNDSQRVVAGGQWLVLGNGAASVIDSEFPYQIDPQGVYRAELTSVSETKVGYALVTLDQGDSAPSGSAIFQFKSGQQVISEAGVGAVTATTAARIFVDNTGTRTGVAIASPNNSAAKVTFNLLDRNGSFINTRSRDLPARGHVAVFADELFPELAPGFTGLMEITSSLAIAPITLKLTTNRRSEPILATLPISDLTRPTAATSLVFPQIGFGKTAGGYFSTRLILINADKIKPATGVLNFYQPDGRELVVPLGNQSGSEINYEVNAGGARSFSFGEKAAVTQIFLDAANPTLNELVVNEGNTLLLRPQAIDTDGNIRTDVALSYATVDPDIATVDSSGNIQGKKAGFSTLTVSSDTVVTTATITVVKISSGVSGFEITGVTQDLGRRLYLASSKTHTVLLAQDLSGSPELYAGINNSAGLRNDERLKSLFRNPSFLAVSEADGTLFVSDSGNNTIRRVRSGPTGQVDTVPLSQALSNPQGVTLDNRGNLWVADSGSHTIKRLSLSTGSVTIVAGRPETPGLADGTGDQARFNSPVGIALQTETLAQQLERERTGAPVPPVSIIVADTGNGRIRRVTEDGKVETVGASISGSAAKSNSSGASAAAIFNIPVGVAVDPLGNIYVTERGTRQVKAILESTKVVPAAQAGTFVEPRGIAISASGRVVVADSGRTAQQITYGEPQILTVKPPELSVRGGTRVTVKGQNFSPETLVIVGGVVVRGVQVTDTQTISFTTPLTPSLPSGRTTVTVQNRGGLAQTVLVVVPVPLSELPPGYITTVAGGSTFTGDGGSARLADLNNPQTTALDSAGNLYIADWFNHRIRKLDGRTGIITTVAQWWAAVGAVSVATGGSRQGPC